ncbi:MAG: hypothetical protein ACOH1O_03400 [Flavobacterium sp.]
MKTIKTRYYLEAKSKIAEDRNKPELIMCEINYGFWIINGSGSRRYKPVRYSLEQTIMPNNFGLKENNYKFNDDVFRRSTKNNATIKTKMLQLENTLSELSNNYQQKRLIPTPEEFKNDLIQKLKPSMETVILVKFSILDFLIQKISTAKENTSKSMKNSKTIGTIKNYQTVQHLIENYQFATKEVLYFETFNEEKYWRFWDILDDILKDKIQVTNPNQTKKQRKQDYGYMVVTLRKHQKTLISTLREAKNSGLKILLNVDDPNLILTDVQASKSFYIESSVIRKIIDSDVSFDSYLQSAKDYFIVASLTGMRYESMLDAVGKKIEILKDKEYNFQYIHSIHNKTSTEVFIPLLRPVVDIVERLDGFPDVYANSSINKYLKRLFEHLQINQLEKVKKVTYRSGTIETNEPIYNLISTHDAKGTFYSNLISLQISEDVISNITHPDRVKKNAMAHVYNKTNMLTKAKLFVDEIRKIESDVYTF